ncbi:indoleamine 2,3-dioxygenase [Cordyceps fumosorosea ARSEF 2679]|uniref:Indoleamine 2,3-dioxygenase n=1 Tax=Cordyceps fumosorosea (strain ARSEF 2679) TaxID=1081104 RepID=A0A168ASM4_CORFA|nr:indoleamine 2,3-dioxygenase [Cordyceps fumosorosea ARSEF 2679]OAA69138.1 indoleamine 2,3-dioxygenase [Cordyceps fumosorosea ARSEF 2679]
MSPHAVQPTPGPPRPGLDFHKYAITRNAFLPDQSPVAVLSDPYYAPWEAIGQNLAELIDTDAIRDAVRRMPLLSVDKLVSEPEWRRAYSMLAFMTHAYVWGGDKPEEILPPQISVPFLQVSAHVELPPVLTYAAANLWNFTCPSGSSFSDSEQLSLCFSFTGTASESRFLLLSVAMVAAGLDALRACIDGVAALLDRMPERCDPMIFYHRIRPFLAGSQNMAAAGLPRGVFYDEGDGKGEWRRLRGGSNGQSSLIQFFDVVLGVEHAGHGGASHASFHEEVREYMPGPHRRFLVHVARMGSIREFAMLPEDGCPEQRHLREAYTAATTALAAFRQRHIAIVTRYIIIPSRQPWEGKRWRQNLASSSSALQGDEKLTGTGGTALVPFLKKARDETTEAGKLQRRQ